MVTTKATKFAMSQSNRWWDWERQEVDIVAKNQDLFYELHNHQISSLYHIWHLLSSFYYLQ